MQTIAVLLTVFNRKEETVLCIKNLFAQSLLDNYKLDVYMVDDACTDGTPEAVAELFPQVKIISSNGDLYWNRGMHLAWTKAVENKDHDFYLWLNDDTRLKSNALNVLIETSECKEHKSIIVGSTVANKAPQLVTYGGRSFSDGLLSPIEEALRCDFFNGNIVLVPRNVYDILGTNDPVFHHSLGDFDYGLRAGKKEVSKYVAPGFLGVCDVHKSLATWCDPKKKFKQRWSAFRHPLGNNPEEFFIYQKRHKGFFRAIFNYFTNHLRVFFPSFWSK